MRQILLAKVRARLERFVTQQDPSVILDPAGLADVKDLLDAAPDAAADLEAMYAGGLLHWFRYVVLEPGDDQRDLLVALELLAPVYNAQPDMLPDPIRDYFANRLASPGEPAARAAQALDLIESALRTDNSADLDQGIDLFRELLASASPDQLNYVVGLSNLCGALLTRFERTGTLADLDEAVSAGRDAVTMAELDDPDRPTGLSNLCAALRTRFEQAGAVADLDEAVTAGRDAVAATPASDPDRAARLTNLCAAWRPGSSRLGRWPTWTRR